MSEETTPSGQPVYRHAERDEGLVPPVREAPNCDAITAHVEAHVGPVADILHEIVSDRVHLDVLNVPEGPDGNRWLVTSGMSDLMMNVPPEAADAPAQAELVMALPPDWPFGPEAFEDEACYWPVRWLKTLARLPHDHSTWLGYGHTVPNGDPPGPIEDTDFVGFVIMPSYWLGADFATLTTPTGESIAFYQAVPLKAEEMTFKMQAGFEPLEDQIGEHGAYTVAPRPPVVIFEGFERSRPSLLRRLFGRR